MRRTFNLVILFSTLGILASLFVGSASIFTDGQLNQIFWDLRVPRTLAIICAGGALSLSGVLLQSILQNSLAEPYTLGIASSSSLGAVGVVVGGFNSHWWSIPLASGVSCIVLSSLFLFLMVKKLNLKQQSLILVGVLISVFLSSVVVFVINFLSADQLQTAIYWMLGEFGTLRDQLALKLWPLFVLLGVLLVWKAPLLDAIALGEARSRSLQVDYFKTSLLFLLAAALLTSLAVSICGPIGFIGLLAPHLARLLSKKYSHRTNLIWSIFIGASFLLLADSLGRIVFDVREIPAGAVVAVLGAPLLVVLFLLRRTSHA